MPGKKKKCERNKLTIEVYNRCGRLIANVARSKEYVHSHLKKKDIEESV